MFFRRRNCSLFRILMLILGLRWLLVRDGGHAPCDHRPQRARARAFRQKMREAMAVWDDPAFDSPPEDAAGASEGGPQ